MVQSPGVREVPRVPPLHPGMQGVGGRLLEEAAARPELTPAHSLAPALGTLLSSLWEMSVSGEKQAAAGWQDRCWGPPTAPSLARPGSSRDAAQPTGRTSHPAQPTSQSGRGHVRQGQGVCVPLGPMQLCGPAKRCCVQRGTAAAPGSGL